MIAKPEWLQGPEELFSIFRPAKGSIVETRHFAEHVDVWIWKDGLVKPSMRLKIKPRNDFQDWMEPYPAARWAAYLLGAGPIP